VDSLRRYSFRSQGMCINCEGERNVVHVVMERMCDEFGITMDELFEQIDAAAEEAAIGGGAAANVAEVPDNFGGGAAHVAEVPAVDDEMAAAIAASLATVNLDDDRRRGLVRSAHDACNTHNHQINIKILMGLLSTNMPGFSSNFSEVITFLKPLNNLTGMNGKYIDGVTESSASFLTRLQDSTEFDGLFEGPEQKQEMVRLMQEFCKRL